MPGDTLPRLLRRNAASMGARPAMREKRHGIWQTRAGRTTRRWCCVSRAALPPADSAPATGWP